MTLLFRLLLLEIASPIDVAITATPDDAVNTCGRTEN